MIFHIASSDTDHARTLCLDTLPADTFVGIPGTGGVNAAPTASTERADDRGLRSGRLRGRRRT